MKCLSIKEPWAVKIWQGEKTIETRTWKTNYRGWILLHASQKPKTPLSGKVFAMVYLFDCRKMLKIDEKDACIEVYPKAWAWVFTKVIPLSKEVMIPMKGKLRLFEIDPGIKGKYVSLILGVDFAYTVMLHAMFINALTEVSERPAKDISKKVKELERKIKGHMPTILIVDEAREDFGDEGYLKIDGEEIMKRFRKVKLDDNSESE